VVKGVEIALNRVEMGQGCVITQNKEGSMIKAIIVAVLVLVASNVYAYDPYRTGSPYNQADIEEGRQTRAMERMSQETGSPMVRWQ
jgi:hypothetical protein